jgi:tetratricopeptide (TPR) repeat protein
MGRSELLSRVEPPGIQATHLLRSARELAHAKRYAAALADIDLAISLAPSFALHDYRGVLLCLMNKVQEALESFTLALSLTTSPKEQAEIYFHRALLYGREKMFDEALCDLAQAHKLRPANATYREACARVEEEKERVYHKVIVPVLYTSTQKGNRE